MLAPPFWLPQEFFQLQTKSRKTISFYLIVPLYQEEMDFKLKKGAEELEDPLEKENNQLRSRCEATQCSR